MTITTGTKLGHHEIRSKLGEGGMGEVYLAEDTRLHRKVALKILSADLASNQDRMRRFKQEAQAAAALNHPNIAHIYEIGESDGTNFIAMEFIDGVTLREKIRLAPKQLTNFTSDRIASFDLLRDGKPTLFPRGATTKDVILISGFKK
jgi:serine/threonine protein kinase